MPIIIEMEFQLLSLSIRTEAAAGNLFLSFICVIHSRLPADSAFCICALFLFRSSMIDGSRRLLSLSPLDHLVALNRAPNCVNYEAKKRFLASLLRCKLFRRQENKLRSPASKQLHRKSHSCRDETEALTLKKNYSKNDLRGSWKHSWEQIILQGEKFTDDVTIYFQSEF